MRAVVATAVAASFLLASAALAQDGGAEKGAGGGTPQPAATPAPIQPSRAVAGTHDCSFAYPRESKLSEEFGYVFLGFDVGADGSIGNVRLIGSSGFARLDDGALACVRDKWRNTPALQGGVPVASPNHWVAIRFWLSQIAPEDDNFRLGVSQLTTHHLDDALATFNAELALNPKSARAMRARSAVYEALGQHDLAAADAAKAYTLDAEK